MVQFYSNMFENFVSVRELVREGELKCQGFLVFEEKFEEHLCVEMDTSRDDDAWACIMNFVVPCCSPSWVHDDSCSQAAMLNLRGEGEHWEKKQEYAHEYSRIHFLKPLSLGFYK